VTLLLANVVPPSVVSAQSRSNVPLKNWGGFSVFRDSVYDDLDRLVTAGLADRVLLNTKPLSRLEAARIVARAIERIRRDEAGVYTMRRDLEPVLDRLMREFQTELAGPGANVPGDSSLAPAFFSFLPVDRAQVLAGYASRDLSFVNGQGLRFRRDANGGVTFESRAQIGDFLTFYLQPELLGNEEFADARLASGYAKLTLFNVELLVGRDSLWWGPALRGSLIFSNNAPPLDQVRIGAAEPFLLPLIGEWVGPTKLLFFLAQLEERRDHPRAKLAGMRGTIAPFSFLELGISRAVQFDGDDRPRLKVRDYPEVLVRPDAGDTELKFRNNNVFAIDADLRLRNVNRYFLPARDLRVYGEFGWDDTCCDDNFITANFVPLREAIGGLMGVHLLGVFGRDNLDARFEYAWTSGLSFTHGQFTDGYSTRGRVISHFIGTDGLDYYARITNRITSNVMLGLEMDRAVVGSTVKGFTGPKERRVGGGVDLSYRFWDRYSIFGQYQVMDVKNRDFKPRDDGLDHLLRLELTRTFR
jgi:hypothetical protein